MGDEGHCQTPKDLILQLEYAELLDLQGRYPELEEIYMRLLKNPHVLGVQRALVLNNLAYLLAVQNKAGDSRKFIDEAIGILGPQSDCSTPAPWLIWCMAMPSRPSKI